jgi:CHAT domain-containing protein/Tfp pilus assembly protein PilF
MSLARTLTAVCMLLFPAAYAAEIIPTLEPDLLALYEQGRQRIASGDLDAGAALWRSAIESLERQAALQQASWLEGQLAKAFAAAGRWPEADAAWERAALRVEPQWASAAVQILRAWGEALQQRSAWDRAEACYRRALRLEPEDSLEAARELSALGYIARRRGDFADAEGLHQKAFAIRDRLAPGSLDLASSKSELGILAAIRGNPEAADELFSKALEVQQRLAADSILVAGTIINLGNTALARGDLAAAEERYRRAIALIERLNPEDPELARALDNLGEVEADRGELALAEEHYRRALAIKQKAASESLRIAGSLRKLGFLAEQRGDFAAAEDLFRRAVEMSEKISPGSPEVASNLASVGLSQRRKGDLAKADDFLRRALEIFDKESAASVTAELTRIERARIAVERGDLALAEELYGRALAFLEKQHPGSLPVAASLAGLGTIALERGNLPKAEELFRRVLAIREKVAPSSAQVGLSLNDLGQVYRRSGRLEMAADRFCRATEVFDQQRKKLGGTAEERSAFGGTTAESYRDCLGALVDIGQPERAFQVLERGRARSFLDLLAERDLTWTADLPLELAREQKLTHAEYDRTQAALARLSAERDPAELNRLLVQLHEIRSRQEKIAAKIRQISPRTSALQDPRPLDLEGVRAALDPGTVLLAWSVGKERSFLFVVRPAGAPGSGLEVFSLSLGDQALRERVASFRNLLQRRGSDLKTISAQAKETYGILLRPADARIAAASRLLFSPDGPLHTLPFAALVRKRRFLVEEKPVHTIISATVYAELKRSRPTHADSGNARLTAFGDPVYPLAPGTAADPELRDAVRRGFALEPLPSSRQEVEDIAARFPQTRTYLGPEATEERAKAIGPESRLVHFACHGLLDERFPLNSALALSLPEHPAEGQDNGLLQAWEIFESVRLDADLVTLSACDTALGKEMGGEGLLGLTRAFQYAGARSVLASLWSISDASTASFMQRFYGYLHDGKSKDEALRAAQIDQIRGKAGSSHPFHWASFELFGDWR